MALDGQTTTTTDNDILRFDSGQLKFVGVSVGENSLLIRPGSSDLASQQIGSDSLLIRSGSGDLGTQAISQQQVLGREEGDLGALSIGAFGKPSSLSALKSLSTSPFSAGDVVYLRGRTSVGDGGEGHFRWDSSDLSTEVGNDEVTAGEGDGGIYVAPDSDKTGTSGARVRQFSGPALPEWYGAFGASDDTDAFSAALTTAAGSPVRVDGTVRIDTLKNSAITVPVHIYGTGTLDGNNDANSGFVVGGDMAHFIVEGVTWQNTEEAAVADSNTHTIDFVRVVDATIKSGKNGIDFDCIVKRAVAHGNKIDDLTSASSLNGIRFGNNNWNTQDQQDYAVYGNTVTNLTKTTDNGECHGIICYGDHIRIFGNRVESIDNSSNGVGDEGIYTKADKGAIFGNTLVDAGSYQGYIALKGDNLGADHVKCFDNTLIATAGGEGEAIWIETNGAKVHDNTIVGFGTNGNSAIKSASSTLEDVEVYDNTIRDFTGQQPIILQHSGRFSAARDNTIENWSNSNGGSTDTGVFGIYFALFNGGIDHLVASRNTVIGPSVTGTTAAGVKVRVDTGNTVERLEMVDNVVDIAGPGNIYDVWLHADGAVTDAQVRGYESPNATTTFQQNNPGNVTRLILDWTGSGSPEGTAQGNADPGSTWKRTDGGDGQTLYTKTTASSSNTGWKLAGTSDGTTGGSGSAGVGSQYVELEIDGTTYKLLHDGTV